MDAHSGLILDAEGPELIGITGGPCSGKTSILSFLGERLGNFGFTVYFAVEAATFLMQEGMKLKEAIKKKRWSDVREYQLEILKFQFENEQRLIRMARRNGGRAVILCDRGLPDSLAYLLGPEGIRMYNELIREIGLTPIGAMERYKIVVKLTTAADGALDFYTLENNATRDETPEEAIALDGHIGAAYIEHPHLRVIDNSTAFEGKKARALKEICHALGIPVPLEIEKKYLLRSRPNLDHAPILSRGVRIEQAYLQNGEDGESRRIRRRTRDMASTHYFTRKRLVDKGVRSEIEGMISWRHYADLLNTRDPKRGIIQKDRFTFLWEGQYFEADFFLNTPEPLYILEIELTDAQQKVILPPWLDISADDDMTDEPYYLNSNIALRIR